MNRAITRRWFAWLALAAFLAQAGLPTLRVATASAGELRAEAILTTALCSKPALSIADRIAALLRPWKQHSSKAKHQHCDSCLQSTDAPIATASWSGNFIVSSKANLTIAASLGVWFASALTLLPPSRAPPVIS
ncbi:MAG: DUF2946 family protein [Burkholderiales bacterium]